MVISHEFRFIFIKTAKVAGTSLELYLSTVLGANDTLTPFWEEEPTHQARGYRGRFNPTRELRKRITANRHLWHVGISRTLLDLVHADCFFENIPAWQIRARVPRKIWDNYYKFTIERNPWDKCVSRYFHSKGIYEKKYQSALSFGSWLRYFEGRLREPWTTRCWGSEAPYNFPRYADPWTDEILVDRVCRYETLNSDLTDVFRFLGVPFESLDRFRAKSSYRPVMQNTTELMNEEHIETIRSIFANEIALMGYRAPISDQCSEHEDEEIGSTSKHG
ncbi:MAG: hypothetical protein KFB96_06620 [Thiocapsa sp.]|uniref:sulfotransferase family 2 domain-containing protein n=1 Tax=Thiocapsa sp. TaxID=2024551 RepID=UPI001BCF5A32|nr:sulfotransferase family 2 domain-containing protein [Thiocapsa sp.]QVL50133.1 MAG: hypothetical protein KFB96_06620 [Thiocapsa sp.]